MKSRWNRLKAGTLLVVLVVAVVACTPSAPSAQPAGTAAARPTPTSALPQDGTSGASAAPTASGGVTDVIGTPIGRVVSPTEAAGPDLGAPVSAITSAVSTLTAPLVATVGSALSGSVTGTPGINLPSSLSTVTTTLGTVVAPLMESVQTAMPGGLSEPLGAITTFVGTVVAPALLGDQADTPVSAITEATRPLATAAPTVTTVSQAGPVAAGATGLESVVMTLDWVPNTNHTGLYVALDMGWYREQGIDLDIQVPSDPAAALKQVATGHTQFGVSFQEELTLARSQNIPIVSLAALLQHNTSAFASLKGSGITRAKDFEGKRYASYGTVLERPVIAGLMACDGGDVNKVEFVDVGFDGFPALVGHRADFIWIFEGWDGVRAELMGTPLDTIPVSDGCVPDYYTPILMAGESTISERPETVRRFLAATARGYQYAIEHPKEAAEILIKHSPESDPELIRRSQAWLSPRYQGDASTWGVQKPEIWKGLGDWMAKNKLLQGPFDPSKAFTNDFLPRS